MTRDHHKWFSRSLNRDMEMLIFGHDGPPVIVFPSSMGAFDMSQFLDGYHDEDCYFLNPPAFLPGLSDPYYLDQFRRNKWVIVTGDHDICRAQNEQFSAIMRAKGIPHALHVWNDSKHDWPYWWPMAQAYVP